MLVFYWVHCLLDHNSWWIYVDLKVESLFEYLFSRIIGIIISKISAEFFVNRALLSSLRVQVARFFHLAALTALEHGQLGLIIQNFLGKCNVQLETLRTYLHEAKVGFVGYMKSIINWIYSLVRHARLGGTRMNKLVLALFCNTLLSCTFSIC